MDLAIRRSTTGYGRLTWTIPSGPEFELDAAGVRHNINYEEAQRSPWPANPGGRARCCCALLRARSLATEVRQEEIGSCL